MHESGKLQLGLIPKAKVKAKLPPGGNIPTYLLTSTYSDIALPNLASMAIRHTCLPLLQENFMEFSTK